MKVSYLLQGLQYSVITGNIDTNVLDISTDSRKVKKNDMFVCICGSRHNSHEDIVNVINELQ